MQGGPPGRPVVHGTQKYAMPAGGGAPVALPGVKQPAPGTKTMPGSRAMQNPASYHPAAHGRGGGYDGRGHLPPPPSAPPRSVHHMSEDEQMRLAMAESMRGSRPPPERYATAEEAEEARQLKQAMEMSRIQKEEEEFLEQLELAKAISKAEYVSLKESQGERDKLYEQWEKEFSSGPDSEAAARGRLREEFERRQREEDERVEQAMLDAQEAVGTPLRKEVTQDRDRRREQQRAQDAERAELKRKEAEAQERARRAEEEARRAQDAEARKRAEEERARARAAREERKRTIREQIAKSTADEEQVGRHAKGALEAAAKTEAVLMATKAEADRLREEAAQSLAQVSEVGNDSRKVHNEIEDLKGSIRVYVRTRPLLKHEAGQDTCLHFPQDADKRSVVLRDTNPGARRGATYDFCFDRAFDGTSTQAEVFEDCNTLCTSAADGFNVCAFAYGQTGSGKTWTLAGSDEDPGVARRSMNQIFTVADAVKAKGFGVKVSATMVELYIDTFFDLLDPKKKQLTLQKATGPKPGMLVGVTELPAEDSKGLLDIFHFGLNNRMTRTTAMNPESSRSHMIYSICIQTLKPSGELERQGKLAIVDLAGSERLAKSGVDGQGAREAIAINKALTALGNVIENLSKKSKHVPFRDHELTQAMQEYLGGNSKTLMFVNVSPVQGNFSESKCSMMFAQRAKKVTIATADMLEANKGKIEEKKKELGALNAKLVELQQRHHDCNLEARKKEAEVAGLSTSISQHRKEGQRLQAEQQKLAAKAAELREQLARLEEAADDEVVNPASPTMSPPPERVPGGYAPDPPAAAPAAAAAGGAAGAWADPPPDELRIDSEDDEAYPWASFAEEYGDEAREKWLRSAPAGAST